MEIVPAIDLRGGRVVRLYQGDYSRETVYGDDPIVVAHRWAGQGAGRVHVVDLDGARAGFEVQREAIGAIAHSVLIPVQVGGGIRTMRDIEALLALGVHRVVLGTVAVEDPLVVVEACRRFGDAIVVGIDVRDGMVAVHGWIESSTVNALELGRRMAGIGVARFVYTDIGRDGTLHGPNLEALKAFMAAAKVPVIASGGVATLDDVERLAAIGVEGVVIGTALYNGTVKLRDALRMVSPRGRGNGSTVRATA